MEEVIESLEIHRPRFFFLLIDYQKDPDAFTISYERRTSMRITLQADNHWEGLLRG
jgi:hypothetical protein